MSDISIPEGVVQHYSSCNAIRVLPTREIELTDLPCDCGADMPRRLVRRVPCQRCKGKGLTKPDGTPFPEGTAGAVTARICERCNGTGLTQSRLDRITMDPHPKHREDTRPDTKDLLGADPNWTGGLSVDEYIKQIRSE